MTKKEFRRQLDIIQELLSIAVASAKIHKIIIGQEGGDFEDLYPPISVWLYSEVSSMKSTILGQLAKFTGTSKHSKITAASLVGSITEAGNNVQAVAWTERRSMMGIDEFNSSGNKGAATKEAILGIIEGGQYKKSIGRQGKTVEIFDDDDPKLYYKVKNGTIDMQTSVGICFCTMVKHTLDVFHMALISRCIPIKYTLDNPKTVFKGDAKLKFKEYKVKPVVKIKRRDWEKIYNKVIDSGMVMNGLCLRTAGTLAKVFAVLGRHDDRIYDMIIALKMNYGSVSEDVGLV